MVIKYRGYEIEERDGRIIVNNVRDFNPEHIFECGQCFRWIRQEDGSYAGVAKGRAVIVCYMDGKLEISNSTTEDFKNIWFDYFDLGRDYSEIKEKLLKDEIMKNAIKFGHGIRLLRQDLWETLISFIISANNRIPMIMKVVSTISQMYGTEIIMNGKSYYNFPDVDSLASSALERLEMCKGGFRCKYILKTAKMVKDGVVNLADLAGMTSDEAREELKRFPGVGNKVADCTLLYSGTKYNVFPTDVWVKRVMEELYFGRSATFSEIQSFAADYFGELAGFAQQYLFYYARQHKIGTAKQ